MTYLCYPQPEWHFKVSDRLATFCGQAAYDALMADMAANANVDRIGEMARFFTAHGF